MDQELRNKLRNVVTQSRRLLEDECRQALEGKFGIFAKKDQVTADPNAQMAHLNDEEQAARKDILDHYEHIKARGFNPKESLDQLVREIAFTHLNRLCAYKMMEARDVVLNSETDPTLRDAYGDPPKFREAVSRGIQSNGLKRYLGYHEEDERLYNTGHQEVAYRHFLDWLGGLLSEEIGVLFNPNDPANRLYPRQATLDAVLELLNGGGIKPEETALRERWPQIWSQDETIGWVYQYFTPKELRDEARKASQAPRNSYELAFRNQFFTPRYVVEFLTDNTLGRIWYEMRQGQTRLAEQCRYLVRQPDEVFFSRMSSPDEEFPSTQTIEAARLLREGTKETFPPFEAGDDSAQRMIEMAHTVSAYDRHGHEAFTIWNDEDGPKQAERLGELTTQQILDGLFMTCRADRHGGTGEVYAEPWFVAMANEVRRRALAARNPDLMSDERLKLPVFIPYRPKKDPRKIRILDPACGSGHFLLYGFDLLLVIYEEAYSDPDLGPALQQDYQTLDDLRRDVPRLILAHNLHGIDIDLRATQIAALALWLRCQRAYQEMGLKKDRPRITRSNFVCAEPMPGEEAMLKEFVAQLEPKLLGQLVGVVFDKMKLAGEAGSLLKIEDEIRDSVATARQQWVAGPVSIQRSLFGDDKPVVQQQRFDLSGITDAQFFEQAEEKVIDALRCYAEQAQNGKRLQRRLFTEDAVRGFAFVDLCHKRFDVALMNPPFGNSVPTADGYISDSYPSYGGDVLTAFITRGTLFAPQGSVGAITSRTAFYLPTFDTWRAATLFGQTHLNIAADLGADVLDEALVEAFVSVTGSNAPQTIPSVRANRVPAESKGQHILKVIDSISHGLSHRDAYFPMRDDLCSIPKMPIAYSAARQLCDTYNSGTRLSPALSAVQQGMSTKNDFRFLRLAFEVPPSSLGRASWAYIAKGGDYRPFYDDIHLVVKAHDDFAELKVELTSKYPYLKGNTDWVLHPEADYFTGGLTYPERTTSAFGPRLMPNNCYFSHVGLGIIPRNGFSRYALLGWLLTRPVQLQVELQAGSADAVESGSAARHYSKALIESLFIVSSDSLAEFETLLQRAVTLAASTDLWVETSRLFVGPTKVLASLHSISEAALDRYNLIQDAALKIILEFDDCDLAAEMVFGLSDSELLDEEVRRRPCSLPKQQPDEVLLREAISCSDDQMVDLVVAKCGFHRSLSKKCFIADRRLELLSFLCGSHPQSVNDLRRALHLMPPKEEAFFAADLLSYLVGVVFGRWDVRTASAWDGVVVTNEQVETIPDCPPGMLVDGYGLPPVTQPFEYPVSVAWNGLLVDDGGGSNDLIDHLMQVCEHLWRGSSDRIVNEMCISLGVKELRDYFRKPGKGGFWDDHVSRYTKSRRKSPIYWLLQSSKKNYALWLYYYRLDKDILFKTLTNYVEPKLRLEAERLQALMTQKAQAGDSGKEAKRLAKEVEKQEDFLSELRDFEDKLRRAANLNLEPDFNDGVVLNIAPLRELVPWKEAKAYWEELLEGKYEWSSIGKQLRQKGLVT
jgi:hypothetical protein